MARNASPFTASAARSGNLLAVHVHHGEHLNALLAHDDADGAISSFVIASVGPFGAASEHRVQCTPATATDDQEEPTTLYTQHYSPFAATRVAENSRSPAWNELLALSLPFERDPRLALRLELVQRGPSHQEDFLLATVVVPLQSVECEHRQVRLALQFCPLVSTVQHQTVPRIYVSLRETTRDCFKSAQAVAADRMEVLVQRFVPSKAPSSSNGDDGGGGPSSNYESLALAVAVSPSAHGLPHDLTQLFTVVADQSQIPFYEEQEPLTCGLTPSAVVANRSTATSFQWHFPLAFELPAQVSAFSEKGDSRVVEIAFYDTSDALRQVRIGVATLPWTRLLRSADSTSVDWSGRSFALSPPLAIHADAPHDTTAEQDAPAAAGTRAGALLGHLHASIRCWSASAWTQFMRETPSRRVVSSNRNIRKTHALVGLEWMGALLRGLNRYPVSSFCDEGGLSSVLVGFLAASSQPTGQAATADTNNGTNTSGTHATGGLSAGASALVSAQVAQLQAETAAQRQQIERVRLLTLPDGRKQSCDVI